MSVCLMIVPAKVEPPAVFSDILKTMRFQNHKIFNQRKNYDKIVKIILIFILKLVPWSKEINIFH